MSLGLPKRDSDLETDYVEREIQLPLLNIGKMEEILRRFTFKEEDSNEARHLLLTIHDSKRRDVYFTVKSNNVDKSVIDLKKYVIRSKKSNVTIHESQLLEGNVNFGTGSKENRLLVVVDYPGKGKTMLLNSLSNRFLDGWSDRFSNCLLLRINLREIKDWDKHGSSSPTEFLLYNSIHLNEDSTSVGNSLNLAIVREKCLNGPERSVFVLLDGYDEISDEQRRITLRIVDFLKEKAKGVKRVILTSRPEGKLENELERRYHQFSLHLKNFDTEEQISYLTKRWTFELGTIKKSSGTRQEVETFATKLVHFAAKSLRDESSTFLDIPLQCWIFSVCFFQELERYLDLSDNDKQNFTFDEASFDLLNLYKRFYDVKIDVMLRDKAGLQEKNEMSSFIKQEVKKSFLSTMMRISTIHLMEDIDEAEAISCLNWDVYESEDNNDFNDDQDEISYRNDLKRAVKLGYVKSSTNETSLSCPEPQDVKFLHRTFSEHFFAMMLLRNFAKSKSELLGDVCVTKQEEVNKRFVIITEKILVADEYAGVRRFFDRMLKKHVPPPGERSPFSIENRVDVLKKWPVFGHEMFNKHLADRFISLTSDLFEKCPKGEPDERSAFELLGWGVMNVREKEKEPQMGLAGILYGHSLQIPSITLLLMHCIKEYACRPDTSHADREALAYSIALTFLMWTRGTLPSHSHRDKLSTSVLRLFDRAPGLPHEANVFSEFFFKLLNSLMSRNAVRMKRDAVAWSCGMLLADHRDAPNFKDNCRALVHSLFVGTDDAQEVCKADQFSGKPWSGTYEMDANLFKHILVSLGAFGFLEDFLLRSLATWFASKLQKYTASIDELSTNFETMKSAQFFLELKEKCLMNPFTIGEIVEFFDKRMSKLPETVDIEALFNGASSYIQKAQQTLIAFVRQVDVQLLLLLQQLTQKRLLQMTVNVRDVIRTKNLTINKIWDYCLMAQMTTHCLQKTCKEDTNVEQNTFQTDAEWECLMAFAHAQCCCQCRDQSRFYGDTAFGIHFPRHRYRSVGEREKYKKCFADKLELVWQKKGETRLIDFLFKGSTLSSSENITQGEVLSLPKRLDPEPKGSAIGSYLKGVDLAKLPCLLFSDLVSEYIIYRLTPSGLRHLGQALKQLPLFKCDGGCIRADTIELPVVTNSGKSLWDAIMQENAVTGERFSCKSKSKRIRAFQDKLRQCEQFQI